MGITNALADEPREPTGAINAESVRIKLQPLGTPMRAQARAHSDGRLVLEAELPWLQLGARCAAEMSDGRSIEGTVHWIGLDMTRSGTARLRILVNTDGGQSIQLSVSDAHVQELLPAPAPKRRRSFRWMLPIMTALLAGGLGWAAANLLTPQPKLLVAAPAAAEAAPARILQPPSVVRIPPESVPAPAQEVAVAMAPTVAPAKPAPAKAARKIVRKHR